MYNRICVTSLHKSIDERALKNVFEPFGVLDSINVSRDDTSHSRGIAVIW